MKAWCALLFLFVLNSSFSQLQFDGRFRLESVVFKGVEYFNRTKGPAVSESRITVTFATPDKNFNDQMNKKPYDYFVKSEFTFLDDSVYIRVGTTGQGGAYRNEYHSGTFSVKSDSIIEFAQSGKPPQINKFVYITHGDTAFTIFSDNGLMALYIKHPDKIDNPMNQPWNTYNVPIILDAYHLNDIKWNELLKDRRVCGIIHKAGQGLKLDPKYDVRKFETKRRNFLWGSYWLGTDEDPIKQAEMYYNLVKDDSLELCCLDLEDVNQKGMMKLKDAEKFIKHWYKLTGKYPVLYCNKNVMEAIEKKYDKSSVFAQCPLWYARFRKDIPDWNSKIWDTYTLWQFSSEINCEKEGECLYNVPGCAHDMDLNVYHGSITEARALWPNL